MYAGGDMKSHIDMFSDLVDKINEVDLMLQSIHWLLRLCYLFVESSPFGLTISVSNLIPLT